MPEETQLLLHELQLRQTELETQNEELRRLQAQLEVSRARYFDLYDLSPLADVCISAQGLMVECNLAAATLFGLPRQSLLNRRFSEFVSAQSQDDWYRFSRRWSQTLTRLNVALFLKTGPDAAKWCQCDARSTMDETGALTTRLVITDFDDARRDAQLLRSYRERATEAANSGRIAIWEVDIQSGQLIWDDNCLMLYRLERKDFTADFAQWARYIHPEDYDRVIRSYQDAVAGTAEYHCRFRIVWLDGEVRHIEAHGRVHRDDAGTPTRMIGTNWDVTEQELTRLSLQASLHDKDALIKEVHHRVKNNLQVISSMMRLEARALVPGAQVDVLGRMQDRLRSMSILHEMLYRTGTMGSVELDKYLQRITEEILRGRSDALAKVQLHSHWNPVHVSMDQAVVCGLLINELLSNALKHAFPGSAPGDVHVSLEPEDEAASGGAWQLCVRDNGVGLPADFAVRRESSLGLQLADDLARQAGGTLQVESMAGGGASFSLSFHPLSHLETLP